MTNFETKTFCILGFVIFSLLFMYTKRVERHTYCMLECMGSEHTEEAYTECARTYKTYTDAYCEPVM